MPNAGAQASENEIWYTAKPHDEDIGLTYMNARYYDPVVGRFMGVDPVDYLKGGPDYFNRYSYVINNPYKYNDPTGKFFKQLAALTVIGLAVNEARKGVNKMEGAAHSKAELQRQLDMAREEKALGVPGADQKVKDLERQIQEQQANMAEGAAQIGQNGVVVGPVNYRTAESAYKTTKSLLDRLKDLLGIEGEPEDDGGKTKESDDSSRDNDKKDDVR